MDVQWRSSSTVSNGQVAYWAKDSHDTLSVRATYFVMEDRLLQNDRFVHRFTAKLTGLQPGMTYEYLVGGDTAFSDVYQFSTGKSEPSAFSCLSTGDVHNSKAWGKMMHEAYERHPESAFYIAAGDLVNTGLYRDDWDQLMMYPGEVFAHIPFMAVPGNHDSQDGLGAWMYQDMFS